MTALNVPQTELQPDELDGIQPDALSIDYLRVVFPPGLEDDVRKYAQFFAEAPEHEPGGAILYRETSERYAKAVVLAYTPWTDERKADPHDNTLGPILEIPGDALKRCDLQETIVILREFISLGASFNRLDIAADYLDGSQRDLITDATHAAIHGCLCRSRTFRTIKDYKNGKVSAHGLNLGKRGREGSGRYVRIYDKGLETGSAPMGDWVRWEAEFSHDVATQVAYAIADPADPADPLALCLGAVEFRESDREQGKSNAKRRPFVPFYKGLLCGLNPYRMSRVRLPSTVNSTEQWFRRSVLKRLATIRKARPGASLAQVLQAMGGEHPKGVEPGDLDASALTVLSKLDALISRGIRSSLQVLDPFPMLSTGLVGDPDGCLPPEGWAARKGTQPPPGHAGRFPV